MRFVCAAVLLIVGCFGPTLPSEVRCTDGACPVGLVCDLGICRESLRNDDAGIDAPIDASIDAGCSEFVYVNGVDGFAGTLDTEIREGEPDARRGTNDGIGWDSSATVAGFAVALLRFDGFIGPNAGQISTNTPIESATLRIVIDDPGQDPAGTLHEVSIDWEESATWNTFGPTPGFENDIGAGVAMLPFTIGEHDIDVTNSVQSFLDGENNFGWAFVPDNASGVDARSTEFDKVDERPRLTISVCNME